MKVSLMSLLTVNAVNASTVNANIEIRNTLVCDFAGAVLGI